MREKRINDFLRLIKEISKSGIQIDSNLVYSNLIRMDAKYENIENCFDPWQERYKNVRNINVFVSPNWKYFCQFKGLGSKKPGYNKLKIYIPLDKEHIYDGVNKIFDFTSKSDIPHQSKVGSYTRFDDVVLRVDSISDAEKIRNFVNNDSYIKNGLINSNPFAFTDGNISFAWDGNLSFNMVTSEWISDYINEVEEVSYDSFYKFLLKRYNEIFKEGKNINSFAEKRGFEDYIGELVNYEEVTEVLLISLKNNDLRNFYPIYERINNVEIEQGRYERIGRLLKKDVNTIEITNEHKEIFDYALIEISKKDGIKYAVECFRYFIQTGNYKVFTRTNDVRNHIINGGINIDIMKKLLYEEQKIALIDASLKTMEKYDNMQVLRALYKASNGEYNGFTNDDNVRNNLKIFVKKEEIASLIHNILTEEGIEDISKEEEFIVYIELIEKLKQKSK